MRENDVSPENTNELRKDIEKIMESNNVDQRSRIVNTLFLERLQELRVAKVKQQSKERKEDEARRKREENEARRRREGDEARRRREGDKARRRREGDGYNGKNYYQIIGLNGGCEGIPDPNPTTVNRAYKIQARMYHPDKLGRQVVIKKKQHRNLNLLMKREMCC
jgi:hypothetical protein